MIDPTVSELELRGDICGHFRKIQYTKLALRVKNGLIAQIFLKFHTLFGSFAFEKDSSNARR